MEVEKTTVTIPKVLADKIKKKCEGTGFQLDHYLKWLSSCINEKTRVFTDEQFAFGKLIKKDYYFHGAPPERSTSRPTTLHARFSNSCAIPGVQQFQV